MDTENTLLKSAKELIRKNMVKGVSSEVLKDSLTDTEELKRDLKNIYEQAIKNPEKTTRIFSKELVDICNQLFQ